MNALREKGESAAAAQVTTYYSQGGYSDWFLPSRDELDFMYKNLKQKNLGGFSSGWYWSSSQYSESSAYCQNFGDGRQEGYGGGKTSTYSVRAARQF